MKKNTEYIDIRFALVEAILIDIPQYVLDVSYLVSSTEIEVQFVVLEGTSISTKYIEKIQSDLSKYKVVIKQLSCSKVDFNENKGNWHPVNYKWLEYVLFSKLETS